MDSLLKTLEEPPRQVVLILTCTDVGRLPLTIVSRCQVVKLGAVPTAEISAALAGRFPGVPAERADLLAHLAVGRPGRALALAADADSLASRSTLLSETRALSALARADRLKEAERQAKDHAIHPEETARRLEALAGWWRDVLLVKAGCEDLVVNRDQLDDLRARAATTSLADIHAALRAVEVTELFLHENVQPRLALESLALALPG